MVAFVQWVDPHIQPGLFTLKQSLKQGLFLGQDLEMAYCLGGNVGDSLEGSHNIANEAHFSLQLEKVAPERPLRCKLEPTQSCG